MEPDLTHLVSIIETVPNSRRERFWDEWNECWDEMKIVGRPPEAIAKAIHDAGYRRSEA